VSSPSGEELLRLYRESSTIAVVGCTNKWPKPSCVIPAYMQSEGYRIVPVNPREDEVLGERCFASLAEVSEPVDIVNVFRLPHEAPAIAAAAVAIGARCVWLQTGIVSEEARGIAEAGGLMFVEDRCIAVSHGQLGLGWGVAAWKAAEDSRRARS
jgi:predicted CoA-binding protein